MARVMVFLADGFEEIEGLTVVDLLRRAGGEVTTVSVMGRKEIRGSHKILVQADELFENMEFARGDMLVLPGGMPGTLNLGNHKGLAELLVKWNGMGERIAAICAAPSVLGGLGILNGKEAVCYPGFEEKLTGARTSEKPVVTDGNIITSRGLGTAVAFASELISLLFGSEKALEIEKSVIYTRP